MSTTYPGSVDSYTTKVDNVDDVLASHVNNLQDAVVASETTIGPSGNVGLCEGRLTLVTGVPISTTDQTAKSTIYFTPYKGNRISLYDGSSGWDTLEFTEKSVSVPATTATPFDVFAYNNGGTLALETVNWTNDTTRATALTTQDGIYVKSGATTRRYLGTGRTTSVSGQTEDSVSKRFLWNYYNRADSVLAVTDSTSHTYSTGSWRSWNADNTVRVEFLVGLPEDSIVLDMAGQTQAGGFAAIGVGIDTTTGNNHPGFQSTVSTKTRAGSGYILQPGTGYHYAQAVEFGSAAPPTFEAFYLYCKFTR